MKHPSTIRRPLPGVLRAFPFLLAILVLGSCLSREARLNRAWKDNPSFRIGYWGAGWKTRPLALRTAAAPSELVEKIRIENQIQGFDERPEAAPPLAELTAALASLEASLPGPVRDLLEERLVGVFCVRELGGTGYADVVYDREGNERFGLVVLDVDVLREQTANRWATWKEQSIFRPPGVGDPVVRVRIEESEDDTTENAVRFILLHELGHVLGMVSRAHPSWVDWQSGKPVSLEQSFVRLSWRSGGEDGFHSRFDGAFPQRTAVRAYGFDRSEIPAGRIPETYRNLARNTDFPTLPAAQSPWEDFAESFATYVHVVLDGRPRVVTVWEGGNPVLSQSPCWGSARCAARELFMRGWMADPLQPRSH